MKEKPTWIIIDLKTNRAIYGESARTMIFSTREVAQEVANFLFASDEQYVIAQLQNY